jgi:hypothetical protein
MSLGDPLVLKDSAAADHNFDIQSSTILKDGTVMTTRVDRASSPVEPLNLIVKQNITGKGTARVRRTLVQITNVQISATTGLPSQLTTNLSWVYPLNGELTTTDVYNALCFIADLVLSTGSLAVDTTKVGYLLQGQN